MKGSIERTLVVVLCAAIGWFYVWTGRSSGDAWNFGAEQTDYYNLLIDGWLDGQLHLKVDVPEALRRAANPYDPAQRPEGGLHDASFYGGKYFLYFGAAPVVTLMLPFRVVTGVDLPMPAAIIAFTFGGFVLSALLWLRIRARYFPEASTWLVLLGIVTLGGASMGLVLIRRGNIWELPLSSGYFFAMGALLAIFLSVHVERRGRLWLALGSLALGLAVASRPTYLFAAPALLAPLWWTWRSGGGGRPDRQFEPDGGGGRRPLPWRDIAVAVMPIAVVGLGLAWHNYARFGSALEFGTKYMLGGANEAQARYFSLEYFGYNADRYFFRAAEWLRYFPFLFQPSAGAMPRGYYGFEEVYGVLPGFAVLWFIPFAALARWQRDAATRACMNVWLAAALLLVIGPAVMLCCFWAAMARYQVDFVPALVLLGGVGALSLDRYMRQGAPRFRIACNLTLGAALVASILFGVLQSLALYGNLRRLNPRTYARVASAFNYPIHVWERLARTPYGPIEMEVRFAPKPAGTREPLIQTGLTGREDRVLLIHEAGGGLRFGCTHDGGIQRISRTVQPDWTKTHRLQVAMGSLYPPEEHPLFAGTDAHERARQTRWWRIAWDGEILLEEYQRFHPASAGTLRVGPAIVPRAEESRFSGDIVRLAQSNSLSPIAPRNAAVAVAPDDFNAVRMTVRFPVEKAGAREPLVSTGDLGRGDFVAVEYLDARRIRFAFDHWGKPTRYSEPLTIGADEAHVVEIALGSFGRETRVRRESIAPVRIRVDERVVWEFATKLFPVEPADVFIGHNPIGGTSTVTSFSGVISSVEWIRDGRAAKP